MYCVTLNDDLHMGHCPCCSTLDQKIAFSDFLIGYSMIITIIKKKSIK